jgi:hypothetical protein
MLFASSLWTPRELTSAVWFDAADTTTITLNGPNVSQWNDKSGNNRHATQATATNQPLFVTSVPGANGLPAIQTDGNDTLQIGNRTGLFQDVGGVTIAIVVKYATGTYSANLLPAFVSTGAVPSQSRFALAASVTADVGRIGILGRRTDADTLASLFTATTRSTLAGLSYPSIQIGNGNFSSAQANNFTNGTQDLTNVAFLTAGNTQNSVPLNASLFGVTGSTNNFLPAGCQLFEVLMFNSTLSTADRQRLEGYLAWKWGTVASLPAGHPFKNSPPYLQ